MWHNFLTISEISNSHGGKFRFVFWDVLPCEIVVERRFIGTCCLWNVGRQLFYMAVHPRRQIWTSFLNNRLPARRISRGGPPVCPPRSPNLTLIHLFLGGYMDILWRMYKCLRILMNSKCAFKMLVNLLTCRCWCPVFGMRYHSDMCTITLQLGKWQSKLEKFFSCINFINLHILLFPECIV
jgi:hypothetical protein